jgi:hypothetical protein
MNIMLRLIGMQRTEPIPIADAFAACVRSTRPIAVSATLNGDIEVARTAALAQEATIEAANEYLRCINAHMDTVCGGEPTAEKLALLYGPCAHRVVYAFPGSSQEKDRIHAEGLANERMIAVWNLATLYFTQAGGSGKYIDAMSAFRVCAMIAKRETIGSTPIFKRYAIPPCMSRAAAETMYYVSAAFCAYARAMTEHAKLSTSCLIEQYMFWYSEYLQIAARATLPGCGWDAVLYSAIAHASRWHTLCWLINQCIAAPREPSPGNPVVDMMAAADNIVSRSTGDSDGAMMAQSLADTRTRIGYSSAWSIPFYWSAPPKTWLVPRKYDKIQGLP